LAFDLEPMAPEAGQFSFSTKVINFIKKEFLI